MRRLLPLCVVGLIALAIPFSAQAELIQPWTPCKDKKGVECAIVRVPKDRAVQPSPVVPGTLDLHIERIPAKGVRTSALVTLVGGPGQSGSAFTRSLAEAFAAPLEGRDLIVIDTRGTGESGFLRCPGLESADSPETLSVAVRGCQSFLGASSPLFTSRDSAADLEAVRTELLGVEKISLYGVSYGTKLAMNYATAYPANVDRLILDSVVLPEGEDLLGRSTLANVRRVLTEQTCGNQACNGITADVAADLAKVSALLTQGPITGTVRAGTGRKHTISLARAGLVALLELGDFDPTLRLDLPGALASAGQGDTAPLLRLYGRIAGGSRGGGPSTSTENSAALFVADLCEESLLPWNRATPEAGRQAEFDATVATVDETTIMPFTRSFLLDSQAARICLPWPNAPAAPVIAPPVAPPPLTAPMLILSGTTDLRTPLSDAQLLASRYPTPGQVTLLQAPGGHSVISNESAECARAAVAAFLAGGAVPPCGAARPVLPVAPLAPLAVSALEPSPRSTGARGRVLRAVDLTLRDAARTNLEGLSASGLGGTVAAGGLRGGAILGGLVGIVLRNDSYVPGVRVSGVVGAKKALAKLRVRGAVHGELIVTNGGKVTGVLNGKPVETRYRLTGRSKSWLLLLDR